MSGQILWCHSEISNQDFCVKIDVKRFRARLSHPTQNSHAEPYPPHFPSAFGILGLSLHSSESSSLRVRSMAEQSTEPGQLCVTADPWGYGDRFGDGT